MDLKLLKKKILKLKNDCVQNCTLTALDKRIAYGANDNESIANFLKANRKVKEYENELFVIDKMVEISKKYESKYMDLHF